MNEFISKTHQITKINTPSRNSPRKSTAPANKFQLNIGNSMHNKTLYCSGSMTDTVQNANAANSGQPFVADDESSLQSRTY